MDKLTSLVSLFIRAHHCGSAPFLLGLSGGPDSLALFHLLLECRRINKISFGVAHVDHGWRPESKQEAAGIEALAQKHGVPFHVKTLAPASLQGNLEAACRNERLKFFASLHAEHGYGVLLLAHHADDHAETVLKRVCEGASLPHLAGLKEVSTLHGMVIWRPFLSVAKHEITEWLCEKGLAWYQDATNEDSRFLRARMRQGIIPLLRQSFGKNVSGGLCQVGKDAAELEEYLDHKLAPLMESIVQNEVGIILALDILPELHPFELRQLVKRFALRAGMQLSREQIESAAAWIKERKGVKKVGAGGGKEAKMLIIDRGRLVIPLGSKLAVDGE